MTNYEWSHFHLKWRRNHKVKKAAKQDATENKPNAIELCSCQTTPVSASKKFPSELYGRFSLLT